MWISLLQILAIALEWLRRNKDEEVGRSKALKKVNDDNQKQRDKVRSIRDGEPILDFLLHPSERTPERMRELRASLSEHGRDNSNARRKLRKIAKNNEVYEKTSGRQAQAQK